MRGDYALNAFAFVLLSLLSGCSNPLGEAKLDRDFVSQVSTFNGWTHIRATGRVVPAAAATDLSVSPASVVVTWAEMSVPSGTIDSYNVYRAGSTRGQNYQAPLRSNISATSRTFTDTAVSGGETYYYVVAPVINGSVAIPAVSADSELMVRVPADNMFLLHRWAHNKEICEQMGKTPDRSQNYRCQVSTGASAPPGTGGSGYLDAAQSKWIDMFEQGCAYTATNACTDASVNGGAAGPCLGIQTTPNGVVSATLGSIYYSRRSGVCYVNNDGATGWLTAAASSTTQRQSMGSSARGLPPLVLINQTAAQSVCNGQSLSGVSGVKRLLKRQEMVSASAWASSFDDTTITAMEAGLNLHLTSYCNSNHASPQGPNETDISGTNPTLAFDNLPAPTAKDTLPGCRFGDCASTAYAIRTLRTGSNATANCESRYGGRDLVGNVYEWSSDQISCDGTDCTGVAATSNTADSTNDDFSGVLFNHSQGPNVGGTFTSFGRIQFPIGIPIVSGAFSGDGTVSRTAAQFHGDYFYISTTVANRGALNGGSFDRGNASGRFAISLSTGVTSSSFSIGFRCGIAVD